MKTLRDTNSDLTSNTINYTQYKNLSLGLLFSSSIAFLAFRRKSLSRSGVAGAILTGTSSFALGGWPWALSLIYFFITSTILSHFKAQQKEQTARDKFSKGNQRDLAQVLANGGVGTLLALGYANAQTTIQRQLCETGYIASLATATADTWATEVGVLSTSLPRLITTGKIVSPGTSGAITPLGITASASGALSLGLLFSLLTRDKSTPHLPWIALGSGLFGSLFDSYLGATIQAMYYCPACQKETERRIHNCGTHTQILRGISWLDNDAVNFLATLNAALLAIFIHWLMIKNTTQSSKK